MNQDRYIELFLGVAWAGAVIVPLNIRWSALENEDALRDCRPKILFVDAAFAAMGREIAERIGSLSVIYADDAPPPGSQALPDYESLLAGAAPVADAEAGDDELAGIFYTGGTTGRSKGVMLSHRNLMANARNALAEGLAGENTVYLNVAPMFHLANAAAMYIHFLAGGSQAVLRGVHPGKARSDDRALQGDGHPAGSDHDSDVRRRPFHKPLRSLLAAADHLRSLSDQRGAAWIARSRSCRRRSSCSPTA